MFYDANTTDIPKSDKTDDHKMLLLLLMNTDTKVLIKSYTKNLIQQFTERNNILQSREIYSKCGRPDQCENPTGMIYYIKWLIKE